jgi:hypothetical protein
VSANRQDTSAWKAEGPEMGSKSPRLLPILLPSWQTTTVTGRQAWNIGPEDAHPWTVLDGLPVPTDQMLASSRPEPGALWSGHAWAISRERSRQPAVTHEHSTPVGQQEHSS